MDAFFQLPIPMHHDLFPELLTGLDRSVQLCISSTKAGRGESSRSHEKTSMEMKKAPPPPPPLIDLPCYRNAR